MIQYHEIQQAHYELAEAKPLYRYVSLTLFALLAPIIVAILWLPHIIVAYAGSVLGLIAAYGQELLAFYTYLPRGYRGERR